jgi:hypothetical protein
MTDNGWTRGLTPLAVTAVFLYLSTFDSYINDPMRWGWLLLFLLALPYVEYIKKWQEDRL